MLTTAESHFLGKPDWKMTASVCSGPPKQTIFQKSQILMCIDKARDRRQVTVLSMTWVGRRPPFGRASGGGSFAHCLLFDGSTARKMPRAFIRGKSELAGPTPHTSAGI